MSSVRWTQEELDEYLRKHPRGDSLAVPTPYLEPNPSHAAKSADAGKEGHSRYCIQIHSKRRRLCDPDGLSCKWVIDGLVIGGIIPDDTPEWVESVSFSQELSEHEETVITLELVTK